jgi:hypothetical protein
MAVLIAGGAHSTNLSESIDRGVKETREQEYWHKNMSIDALE